MNPTELQSRARLLANSKLDLVFDRLWRLVEREIGFQDRYEYYLAKYVYHKIRAHRIEHRLRSESSRLDKTWHYHYDESQRFRKLKNDCKPNP